MQRSLSCIAVRPPVIPQKAVLTLYRANPGREGYLLFSPWILSYAKHLIRALVATPESNMGRPVS